jgi:hypothetical protein
VTFEPTEPVHVENVGLYVIAYRLANRVVSETAAYFPEIELFRVSLAGKERVLSRDAVVPKSFYLQADLLPADKVLGLVVRDQGLGSGTLEPSSFKPAEPLENNQLAILAVSRRTTNEDTGRLYRPILTDSARIIVTEVGADGTATAFVLPNASGEVPAGPVSIAPGAEEVAASQWILNMGLLDRPAFGQ